MNKNTIKNLLEAVKKIKNDAEFDIVYRNENILLVAPKTHSAACRYGSGTKWCTARPDSSSFDYLRKDAILFYLILYKDTPEGKIEDYKISIQKMVNTGAETWQDMLAKKINNMEMFKRFILTDPMVTQSMNEYWTKNRIIWKPKFQIGEYVMKKDRTWSATKFKSTKEQKEMMVTWNEGVFIVIDEKPNKLLVQLTRLKSLHQAASDWKKKQRLEHEDLMDRYIFRKWVNPYDFKLA